MTGGERSDEGWASDDERKLFVRAVQRFSQECEAPTLTPECPYFELTDAGDAICAEQCMDVVARHRDDLVRPDSTDLGLGLDAIRRPRPRPRRGPDPRRRAFDARELRLSETGPPDQWQTPSLILELRDRLMFPDGSLAPPQDPEVDLRSVANELDRRGIDVEKLVRLGMSPSRLAGLMVQWAVEGQGDGPAPVHDLVTAYHDATGITPPRATGDVREFAAVLTPELYESLMACLQRAELGQALDGQLPTLDDLLAAGQPLIGEEVEEQIWLLERFTETFLTDWKRPSVIREWRYLHAQHRGCCPARVMRERQVDRDDLACEVADRAISSWDRGSAGDRSGQPWHGQDQIEVSSFASIAHRDVRAGRAANAAALYRGLVELRPDSVEVRNNLGFCLIPDDPKAAAEQLDKCIELAGENTTAMHLLNLALARHRVGDHGGAWEALRTAVESETLSHPATMWSPTQDGLRIGNYSQLGDYALELETHLVLCPAC